MKTSVILDLKGVTPPEIFEKSLFRPVQFESIFNHRESLIAQALI